ncbi:helix-turn-helix transcriptional regulator [Streptomyces sp. NPDC048623]|uniref:helix-turn-helix domain-containing protein n=1 Tax=Streptomyces sp. NPDC048623 TaxID=3155761 RepID=UPI0034493EB3
MGMGDGFAEQMRGLKERSGLSYGALAKRLHVSTSTLHRYCNGDAVPAEFAPVERLGRLCGASRDELMDLHRAWILADEARRAPVRADSDSDAEEPEPEAPGPEALGPEPGPGPAPAPAPEPVVLAAPAPAPARKRRPRAGLIAAVALVALAVPATYLVGRVTADPKSADTDGAGSVPAAEAPLSVGISSYNWAEPCGQYFLLGQDPGHVPPPPAPQDSRSWARSLDGIDGGHMQLQLTVTGRTQAPVVLSALHVRVVERGEPLDRFAYSMGDGCGGGITPQTFDIDLDAPRPYVKPVAGHDGDRVVPAKDFPYQVATGDAQVLDLDVHTERNAATWYLELDWSSGDAKGRIRVDDGGQPFRTSAIEGRPVYGYWPDKGEWVKQ